jgi:pyrroloquinoline quinone (PQQ) biosynthesis protein C
MHLDRDGFREALLDLMDRKTHWAWPLFTSGRVPKERLHLHLEQEYASYVRDFPVLVARAYVACPIAEVRRELIANVYEEETGGLAAGRPHPELFLEVPRGLGMDLARFDHVELLPKTAAYRATLDALTTNRGWEVAAAIATLFLEGTRYERGELDPRAEKRPSPPLDQHPLVVHYGLPVERLALTRAHRQVEGSHRASAWRILLDHIAPERRADVVAAMAAVLEAWRSYRDGVAEACGLERTRDAVEG